MSQSCAPISLPETTANAFPVAMFTATRQGELLWLNAEGQALLGLDGTAAPGTFLSDCMWAEDWGRLAEALLSAGGKPVEESARCRQADGSVRRLRFRVGPADIGGGKTGLAGGIFDLGEDAGATMEEAFEGGAAVIYRTKLSGQSAVDLALAAMSSVSANVTELLGYSPDDVLHADGFWAEKLHEDDLDAYSDALVRLLRDGRCVVEYRLRDASGEYRWLRDQMRLCRQAKGQGFTIAGTWLDVTDRRDAELAARTAEEQAHASSRAKSEFLAMMSHEIRTPMNGVLGMVDLLATGELDARQTDCVRLIRDSADALLRIIDDILDFSKLDTGNLQLETIAFDLRQTLDAATAIVRPSAKKKGLGFTCRIDAEAPSTLRGDPVRIRQILLNLLSNAVKFTDEGSVDVTVKVQRQDERSVTLRFAVSDTGIGIAAPAQSRLFERFSQIDSSIPRQYGGTGLGLAISKQLCTLMSGEIGVTSEDGQGSTFWFEIPFEIADKVEPADAEETALPQPAARSMRVLVAEDNAVNQQVIAAILTQLGHEFELAANGRDAVEMVRSGGFDLVLMDIQMPVVDGVTAAKIIRLLPDDAGRIPMVALTANAMTGDRDRYLGLGFDGYVSKPINIGQLSRILANCGTDPQSDEADGPEGAASAAAAG